MSRILSHLLFLCIALMISLLPLRVQAALPKELPAAPAKFLTGACLTRSEDLWITAEAGGVYRLSGQEMKPKWEDMRKQPGFPKTDNCTITGYVEIERLKGVPYLYKTDKGWSADIPFLKHDLFNQWTLR